MWVVFFFIFNFTFCERQVEKYEKERKGILSFLSPSEPFINGFLVTQALGVADGFYEN